MMEIRKGARTATLLGSISLKKIMLSRLTTVKAIATVRPALTSFSRRAPTIAAMAKAGTEVDKVGTRFAPDACATTNTLENGWNTTNAAGSSGLFPALAWRLHSPTRTPSAVSLTPITHESAGAERRQQVAPHVARRARGGEELVEEGERRARRGGAEEVEDGEEKGGGGVRPRQRREEGEEERRRGGGAVGRHRRATQPAEAYCVHGAQARSLNRCRRREAARCLDEGQAND